jgi:hypothetical protein
MLDIGLRVIAGKTVLLQLGKTRAVAGSQSIDFTVNIWVLQYNIWNIGIMECWNNGL